MPYGSETTHELRTKSSKSVFEDKILIIIALPGGRVQLQDQLAQVCCVLEKVLKDSHGAVIVVEVDLSELGALA